MVPVLKSTIAREIPGDFAAEFVVQLPCSRIIISFQGKIEGHLANVWVRDFALAQGLRLKLEKPSSFHILQVIGDNSEADVATLLSLSPVSSKGHYAIFLPFDPTADLRQPRGLKQLIQVTFSSTLSCVEKGLDLILADIGRPLCHRKEKKGQSTLYTVLVETSLDYFVPSATLTVSSVWWLTGVLENFFCQVKPIKSFKNAHWSCSGCCRNPMVVPCICEEIWVWTVDIRYPQRGFKRDPDFSLLPGKVFLGSTNLVKS